MLKLCDRNWQGFRLSSLMNIKNGKRLESYNHIEGNIPYAGASDSNNGITDYVSNINESTDGNTLAVNYNGSVCESFYHPYDCTFSDDVKHLHLKNHEDNSNALLFFANSIMQQKIKYMYSYKFNGKRMDAQNILLPVNDNGEPDYAFMEQYVKQVKTHKIDDIVSFITEYLSKIQYKDIPALEEKEWDEFQIGGDNGIIQEFQKGGCNNASGASNGIIPYVGATNRNNGTMAFVDAPPDKRSSGDCLFFVGGGDGAAGLTGYKVEDSYYAANVICGYSNKLNIYIGQFISCCVDTSVFTDATHEHRKYSRGNPRNQSRLERDRVLLPINDNGEPDYAFMEQYVKNLMIRKYEAYLKFVYAEIKSL